MSAKIQFLSGAAGTGMNVYDLAEKNGMFDTPGLCFFTIILGLVFCVCGGITIITLTRYFNRLASRIK
jgi:hypothetical protein